MSDEYVPSKVWRWEQPQGGRVTNLNRPISGPTRDAELPVGNHPFQLYSLATPNGQKAGIMFEELLAAGHNSAEYDAWFINIGEGDQFSSGFVAINPNSKIPAMVDRSGSQPIRVFESGAILLYLAEKFGAFVPQDAAARVECLSWLFWQVGSAPFIGGGFGHFYAFAPEKLEYPINRYAMETKRLFHVADTRLKESRFLAGAEYTIADIATFPWLYGLYSGRSYNDVREFLSLNEYEHVGRWIDEIAARPAVMRGLMVNNRDRGIMERHNASDFEDDRAA